MIIHAFIEDIALTDDFMSDFESVPQRIKKKVNSLIEQILDGGKLPNSLHPHQSFMEELWIGYVNRAGQHWRLLFWHDEINNTIILHRLLTHNEMDRYVGKKVRS